MDSDYPFGIFKLFLNVKNLRSTTDNKPQVMPKAKGSKIHFTQNYQRNMPAKFVSFGPIGTEKS